ncbi:hypothetical protein B0H15DRAFT_374233 [Mycena belliarum]|uniref:OTU domain-containing protein n=1 Tax=Mycena belliarum TaxID=1033014 RepID=A0AAD6U338_9AGAR|nr:hypothetical protein B0H15DRAFT_374233 [Mycena belliae]
MGTPKKNSKKPQSQPVRPRTTRSSKARLLSDPLQNTALLTEQLRSLGLYAAPTLGDGNCLFRALSDQLYGSPSRHAQLRKDVCDWIARHKARYEPFVEDDRGLDVHLRCMRENATYGGHMELSAFAHLTRRNVKVIQPGLVYVIEWAAGAPLSPSFASPSAGPSTHGRHSRAGSLSSLSSLSQDGSGSNGSGSGAAGRWRKDKDVDKDPIDVDAPVPAEEGTVYVAYHDWEHFSSIRNLKGPHTGLPEVRETPPYPYPASPVHVEAKLSKERKKRDKVDAPPKKPVPKVRLKLSSASPTKAASPVLPASSSRLAEADAESEAGPSAGRAEVTRSGQGLRVQRSPKRSFDESSGSAGSESESVAKRTRSAYAPVTRQSRAQARQAAAAEDEEEEDDQEGDVDVEMESGDEDEDAEGEDDEGEGEVEERTSRSSGTSGTSLSLSLSPPALSSSSSLSSLSSMSPSPPPPEKMPVAKALTRRQRKALGLPKTRANAAAASKAAGAGKIVIPGGRYEGTGEWRRNGTGRVDVRGFRELKI